MSRFRVVVSRTVEEASEFFVFARDAHDARLVAIDCLDLDDVEWERRGASSPVVELVEEDSER